jgi:putative FmdB family regulatory protein
VQFERQQKFSDEPLKWCPECDKNTLRKVYTPVGIVFKGSGFYATDNRSPSGASHASRNNSTTQSDTSNSEKTDTPKTKSDE